MTMAHESKILTYEALMAAVCQLHLSLLPAFRLFLFFSSFLIFFFLPFFQQQQNIKKTKLGISNLRELEDLVIEGIYYGLLEAKLDQKNQHVEVVFAMGRDLHEGDVAKMIQTLNAW